MKKTNLQKYKDFFDEMKIKYSIEEYDDEIWLCIDKKHIEYDYGNSITTIFNINGKFKKFEAYGT